MTDQQDSPKPLDSETVAAYLRLHPEFFIDHDELIPELRIPHQRGDTVSLVERQVKLLRERNIEMRHRLSQLMDVARDNDRLFDKTRRLVLDLLDATSLEEVVSAVEDSLRREFQVPFVGLILFSDAPLPVGRSVSSAEEEFQLVFAQYATDGLAAVVALTYQGLHGVLAIGSADPQHYKSSLGTLFLGYIAEVLARVLPRFATPLRSVR